MSEFPSPPPTIPTAQPLDAEREFGARYLPWIGALSVIGGLIYLVNYAIQRELIGPEIQMIGAAILAATFAVVGLWISRGEGESRLFGNILVGLGSCGLYMTAGGGHAGWKIITGEAMIIAFVLIALLTTIYGHVKSLPPFVMLGIAGGAIASAMLGYRGEDSLAAGVITIVGVPAYISLISRRFPFWIGGVWLAGEVSLLFWQNPQSPIALAVVGIWMLGGLVAHAFCRNREMPREDLITLLGIAVLGIVHLRIIAERGWGPAAWIAVVGMALAVISRYLPKDGKLAMLIAAGILVGILAPTCVPTAWMSLSFAAMGLVMAIGARQIRAELGLLAIADLAVAAQLYLISILSNGAFRLPFDERAAIPIFIVIVVASAGFLGARIDHIREFAGNSWMFRLAAAIVSWILVSRFVDIQVGAGELRAEAMTISWGCTAIATFLVGNMLNYRELRVTGLAILMITLGRTVLVDLAELESVYKVMILIGVGIVSLAISYAFYIKPSGKPRLL